MAEIKYEIKETICTLSENNKGWSKELNLISWNDREPKYDIRDWAPDHEKMGKGRDLLNGLELDVRVLGTKVEVKKENRL